LKTDSVLVDKKHYVIPSSDIFTLLSIVGTKSSRNRYVTCKNFFRILDSTYVHIFLFYVNIISQIQQDKMLVVIRNSVISCGFSEVRVARSLVFCVVFCRLLFVLLSFFYCPLCYLSFFDLLKRYHFKSFI
jgi:hypothetical protein